MAVNNQITDAVNQANVKVLAEAPAMAMSNLYQATAQALSNAAHNAVNAQQQLAVLMQAATTQGVMQIYSIDTAATPPIGNEKTKLGAKPSVATEDAAEALTASISASFDKSAKTNLAEMAEQVDQSNAALNGHKEESNVAINEEIEAAIKFVLESILGSADEYGHGVVTVMTAFTDALAALGKNQLNESMAVVKMAATCMTLKAMIAAPDKQEAYGEILQRIHAL
jgi:hypothetical protein